MGAANSDGKLYDGEIQQVLAAHSDRFRVDYALSREGPKVRCRTGQALLLLDPAQMQH